ncbi:MAG: hypothetical protein ASARMPREDX12_008012 [Alectoria sarmentosa]|nr:MAG: hypothetical protein ASARMPREDX12_008012 [Alectoria sarmentosa]
MENTGSSDTDLRIPGYITGYVRRFWQASEDHRGTPESPGRVVTLIERSVWETLGEEPTTTPERVYGAAYRIPPSHVKEVQEYLDIREINGYSIQYTTFSPSPSTLTSSSSSSSSASTSHAQPIGKCLVYIGLPSNPQFLGLRSPHDVAEVISRSTGPSGANAEYLFMLEDALRDLGDASGDEHVADLAGRVRSLMKDGNVKGTRARDRRANEEPKGVNMQAVEKEAERVRSGEGGQAGEETEKVSQL